MRAPFAFAPLMLALASAAQARPCTETEQAVDCAGIRTAHESWQRRAVPTEAGHVARHPAQAWRCEFDGLGVAIAPDHGAWTWGLALERWGFPGSQREIAGHAAGCAEGERVEYAWDAALTEWYVHGASGLEHGYTVHRRPPGDGPLVFELAVHGTLVPAIDADARGVRFVDETGATVLTYAGLRAFDATQRELDARLVANGHALHIEVDERGARYPITIDPLAQQAYLKASNTGAGDGFGISVGISGDTAVVGAFQEASSATGVNGNQFDEGAGFSGAAYVFVRSGGVWSQQAYLKASNTGAGDWFGFAVAISGDTIVVGARLEDGSSSGVNGNQALRSANSAGAAYVFVRSGTVWTQQAYLKASNPGGGIGVFTGDEFGIAVAIAGDTIAVGAYHEDSSATGVGGNQADNSVFDAGAAYVFTRSGTTWSQQAYVKPSNPGVEDDFGGFLAVHGDTLVVGAAWEDSNATGIDGNGADNSASNAGAAYVYVRSGTVWSQQAYLKASNARANQNFGAAVTASGNTIIVGALNEQSAATGVNGDQASTAAGNSGAAYVFTRSGAVWSQQAYLKASNTASGDQFGAGVALDGDLAVVGGRFEDGSSTGIDGNQADNAAAGSGAAYVFRRGGTTWGQVGYLKASNTGSSDEFGDAVALSGSTIVIGAYREDSGGTGVGGVQADESALDAGAAYVYVFDPSHATYCYGDGSGAACPCSPAPVPHGAPGRGCPTNVFAGGALAGASGVSSVSADTLVLTGTDMINGSMIFYQGATRQSSGSGAAFGDGLRCVQATGIRRFKTKLIVGNTASYPQGGDPLISVAGLVVAPGTYHYQGWYRSANPSFCTVSTFNLTNGVSVTWMP